MSSATLLLLNLCGQLTDTCMSYVMDNLHLSASNSCCLCICMCLNLTICVTMPSSWSEAIFNRVGIRRSAGSTSEDFKVTKFSQYRFYITVVSSVSCSLQWYSSPQWPSCSDGSGMGDNSKICPKIVVKNYALGWSCITGLYVRLTICTI
jgi:hypothetical protein